MVPFKSPSSQISLPKTNPSPHIGVHFVGSPVLSQVKPINGPLQFLSHPSSSLSLPSSHVSFPFNFPSPQTGEHTLGCF